MTSIDRSRKHEFTGMGELYDRARPSYPPALFGQLDYYFNFRMGQTTLEIGCGTGKATEHLAARVRGLAEQPDQQIAWIYRLALGREPGPRETRRLAEFAAQHGLENAARATLNSNEFLFVD